MGTIDQYVRIVLRFAAPKQTKQIEIKSAAWLKRRSAVQSAAFR